MDGCRARTTLRTTDRTQPDGMGLNYPLHGSGSRTVVFLHGLAGYSGEWDRTMTALGSEFTTVALDQRGHGSSCRDPADISREAFVADVVTVLDELDCREPVTLVGQSMGSHTAFLTAAWHPDHVERLVMA